MKPVKKILYYILFPFVLIWIALGVGIYYIGNGLSWIGNGMTGGRCERSIGSVYVE